MSKPIREPGWYRIKTWEPVDAKTAKEEIDAGGGDDLILVKDPGPGRGYQPST